MSSQSAPPESLPAILRPTAIGQRRSTLMVTDSAMVLKRLYFLERELIRMVAGWIPGIEDWPAKLLLPEVVWQDSLVARSLRERILELRYPERRIALDEDRPLMALYAAFADAPNELAFLAALATVIKPHVRGLFAAYLEQADLLDDAPSSHFLGHALTDLDHQIERLRAAAERCAVGNPQLIPATDRWCSAMAAALAALPSGIYYQKTPELVPLFDREAAGGKAFTISRRGVRDRRFQRLRFAWPDRHTPQPPGTGMQLQIRQAIHHLNEVWAAEMAAACLYDLMDAGPHDFLDDAGRWCFDEIRHCRMGYERLKEWGLTDAEMPLDTFSYDAGETAGPLVRLGIIFFFETTYIHTKPERAKIFGEAGDRMSSHDMDFDWADELIHTHYGKKWLEYFLAQAGTGQKAAEIKQLSEQAVVAQQRSASEEDKIATQAVFDRTLARARVRLDRPSLTA